MKAYLTDVCGIPPERILIDEQAKTTEENAANTFAILQGQGVETITIVTSSYHQRRGQALYNAMAALYRQQHGYGAEIVGNYCLAAETDMDPVQDMSIAILQLASILKVPEEQMGALREKLPRFRKR